MATNATNSTEANGFEDYKNALIKYRKSGSDAGYDRQLSAIFQGSKVTARFIFRSLGSPTQSNYNKDIAEFGKEKVTSLVNDVLNIIK